METASKHMGFGWGGEGGGGSRPGKVLGVLNTAVVGAGQVLGTAEHRLGRKGHGS